MTSVTSQPNCRLTFLPPMYPPAAPKLLAEVVHHAPAVGPQGPDAVGLVQVQSHDLWQAHDGALHAAGRERGEDEEVSGATVTTHSLHHDEDLLPGPVSPRLPVSDGVPQQLLQALHVYNTRHRLQVSPGGHATFTHDGWRDVTTAAPPIVRAPAEQSVRSSGDGTRTVERDVLWGPKQVRRKCLRGPTFPVRAGMFMELVAKPIPNAMDASTPRNRATRRSSSS
ncbi:hypothetical protein EYF80_052765 [Liparis tanakae]|uniref:Uncharacterized protein n=1 Tax=Liparis tanakae TaxID=230148 RepID=A0A4Z2F795_9TELE|nr:hypothetical protein EYF80_052765 [Liparis tanakae]